MSDAKKYSEREVVERERKAYENGMIRGTAREYSGLPNAMELLRASVRDRYPLPKTTRQRVVTDYIGTEWRWDWDRGLEVRHKGESHWETVGSFCIRESRRQLIADLLANPTEECEE